jgi:hypothetical protein
MFGVLILIIGLFYLLKNLGLITDNLWSILWPLLVIAIGLKLILIKKHSYWEHWGEKCCHFGEKMHKTFHEKHEKEE